jgi:hypothetical protein
MISIDFLGFNKELIKQVVSNEQSLMLSTV